MTDAVRWPRWLEEVCLTLSICPQFILYGNIRDKFPIPLAESGSAQASLVEALWTRLRPRGYDFLLVYDPTLGLSVHPPGARATAAQTLAASFPPAAGLSDCLTLALDERQIAALVEAVSQSGRCGLVVENASRLLQSSTELAPPMLSMFAKCAQLSQTAAPRQAGSPQEQPLFNPVFWLVDAIHDLPSWLTVGGERSRSISVALPDTQTRLSAARQLAVLVEPGLAHTANALEEAAKAFAGRTDGLTLREMEAVANLARDEGLEMAKIAGAIRRYKVGITDNPWNEPGLRESIANGEEKIRKDVKGQEIAVRQALDILIRSVMGLHGAHASSSSSRPRGVLFFAGPTGVGKTELAKAISKLLFNDPDACLRFDMSEYSAEHSEARLIGAPPGYVGYDAGGELVNKIRQRPFSVVLFDEIEKAHARILDKFLQILEDGRLTDGRGDTVHFSEAVLIFTSNLGTTEKNAAGKTVMRVHPGDSYENVKAGIIEGINEHFRSELRRPEILNRLGENIVVFDFISEGVANEIFDKAVDNVSARLEQQHKRNLKFTPEARAQLQRICIENLENGGRGIGNKLEQAFVNPLARVLFEKMPSGPDILVEEVTAEKGKYSVRLYEDRA